MKSLITFLLFAVLLVCVDLQSGAMPASAEEPPTIHVTYSVEFARVDDKKLLLDIYRSPLTPRRSPVVIWVHGGAWRRGSRTNVPIEELCHLGFAVASVDYRLSTEARFPAQVHDIKAAIRYLRANASKYALDPNRFYIAGASAGGHLAALVGVSSGVQELEGEVGDHPKESSKVRAIVSYYGASNLQSILAQSTPHGLSVREPALKLLLGGTVEERVQLARLASPVAHVSADDPPLLLIHGDQDPQMPINQAHELEGKYEQQKLPVRFRVVHGGKHGGSGFYDRPMLQMVADFLKAIPARAPASSPD